MRIKTMTANMSEAGFLLLVLCSGYMQQLCGGATIDDAKALHSSLMADYNKYIRPVRQQHKQVVVNMSMSIVALQEFDEVLEKFSVVGVFFLTWTDENIVWDASNHSGINEIFVGYKDVWVPEIILTNPSEKLDSFGEDWQLLRYNYNGLAQWFPGDLIKATCAINVYYFPFDIQECHIEVYAWGYSMFEVLLQASQNTIETSLMTEHGSWTIIETKVKTEIVGFVSKALFVFRLERKPQYIMVNVVLPILFLCLLNVLVFLLPPESGERVSYSITVLLAIAVFMTIVSDTLPKTSEPLPLISYLLMSCLIVSALITCVAILNLRLFHKKSDSPVPAWLMRIYNILKCDCNARCKGKKGQNEPGYEKDNMPVKDIKIFPANKIVAFTHEKEDMETVYSDRRNQEDFEVSVNDSHCTWQDISIMVDYISLASSVTITVLGFMLFLIVTKVSSN